MSRVDTGRPDDRVYLLTFATSDARRFFFWMQEPDSSKDEERVAELNRLMNATVPQPMASRGNPFAHAPVTPAVSSIDLGNILDSIGLPPPPSVAITPAQNSAPKGLTQEDLNKAFRDVAAALKTPSLSEVLTTDELEKLFSDPMVHESFLALLPENRRTEEELRATIHSPQLRQALDALSKALQSENLEAIMASFD